MELLYFATLTYLAYLILRAGLRPWKKEAAGRNALAKRISADTEALWKESEAWFEKQWERKFKGGTQ